MATPSTFRACAAIALFLALVPAAPAQYSGGRGVPDDPYQIATAADLIALGETPEDYDKHFILTADIDLDPNLPGRKVFDKAVIGPGWETPFTGVFDGSGHTISHLTITGGSSLGLFGQLSSTASVSSIGMEDVEISGIESVGGLAGNNSGSITNCYNAGCVSGTGWSVGGLVGSNSGSIGYSYSTTTVSGSSRVGGLVGSNSGSIASNYSTGLVSGSYEVGGLVGCNFRGGTVRASYSSGSVSGSNEVGGLVGSGYGGVLCGVWDVETSGLSASAGGVGLATDEMMDPHMLGLNGFGNDPNWVLDAGRDYPHLAWEGTPGDTIPAPDIDWLEGKGTADSPYRIDIPDQLMLLHKASIFWDKHLTLAADIDLDPGLPGGKVFAHAVIPLFTGVFDGGGYVISNLVIEGDSYLGLFGLLAFPAEVRNVGVVDVNIAASGSYVGGLVGANGIWRYFDEATQGGMVANCHSSGSISGKDDVGGLVGLNSTWGTVTASYSSGSVTGNDDVGGLVGDNFTGGVTTSYSDASVHGSLGVGGLVGSNIAWDGGGRITGCYSTGSVSGISVGGLVGYDAGSVSSSFWDSESSGQATSDGGTGLTTAKMQTASTFLIAGWDFLYDWADGMEDIWWIDEGKGYPRLSWEAPVKYSVGSGTAGAPYRIDTPEKLVFLGTASILWDKHFILAADIDLAPSLPGGQVFAQAVIPTFTGVFDGNGQKISHLTIRGGHYLGLFGELASGAVVKNLRVLDVSISGSGESVGVVAGENDGSVMQCHSTGTVGGNSTVGGLVGMNHGDLTQCYCDGAVNGRYIVGGMAGGNSGSISTSYSSAAVTGDWYVGGLVGYCEGGLANCSFWDIQASGQDRSDGGTGKTTAEMQTARTFLDAGWNFVGETDNGTDDIWWILEGKDYPRLWWEAVGTEY